MEPILGLFEDDLVIGAGACSAAGQKCSALPCKWDSNLDNPQRFSF